MTWKTRKTEDGRSSEQNFDLKIGEHTPSNKTFAALRAHKSLILSMRQPSESVTMLKV